MMGEVYWESLKVEYNFLSHLIEFSISTLLYYHAKIQQIMY